MRIVRIKGIAAFLVIVAVLAVAWFAMADVLVKRAIEEAGTRIVGARVELDHADLTLSPVGLTLTGLKVTNPDEPMTNAVEAARVAFTLDGGRLLLRKINIDEMTVDRVRLNTPRKTSGAVSRRKAPRRPSRAAAVKERLRLPSLELKTPEEILAGEKLASVEIIGEVRSEVSSAEKEWRRRLEGILDKEKIEEFRKRAEGLKDAPKSGPLGMVGAADEVLALQKDIRGYVSSVKAAREDLAGDMKALKEKTRQAAEAPAADVRRLVDKYGISAEGLSNLSALVFGPALAERTDKAVRWYERLAPVMRRAAVKRKDVTVVKPLRGEGEYVRFPEREPAPDLLVRKALVSVELAGGEVSGVIRDLTPDQRIHGRPTTAEFSGSNLKGLSSLAIKGELDRTDPERPVDIASLKIAGYGLKDVKLGGVSGITADVTKALADIDVKATLSGGAGEIEKRGLDGKLSAVFRTVEISAGGGEGRVAGAIATALEGVGSFRLNADVTGTLGDYSVKLGSDLDRVLSDAVGKLAAGYTGELREGLAREISKRTDGPLRELTASLGGLEELSSILASRLDAADDILSETAGGLPGGLKLPF